MKIPRSIRTRYEEIVGPYQRLKTLVDQRIRGSLSSRWHYESRLKQLESYALKLETGRERFPGRPEDMLGCTIVVENHSRIAEAGALVISLFKEEYRRPADPLVTSLFSDSFAFEDLRIYVSWLDDDALPPTGLSNLLFEVQVKTFLQHAWGIATHDLVYKSDGVNWSTSRVAFQVKAMLENAELSISEVQGLKNSVLLNKTNSHTATLSTTIGEIKMRWPESDLLPENLLGLARNIIDLSYTLRISLDSVWRSLDDSTSKGRGAKLLDLSPYGAIFEALISKYGASLLKPLGHANNKKYIFVPLEVELPALSDDVRKWIVTPKS